MNHGIVVRIHDVVRMYKIFVRIIDHVVGVVQMDIVVV